MNPTAASDELVEMVKAYVPEAELLTMTEAVGLARQRDMEAAQALEADALSILDMEAAARAARAN